MTFQEFLELNYDKKYVTLDNFYRDHLYLRTLAKRFYGDKSHRLGTCVFTKDGDFLRSRPTDNQAFKSNCSTVLFDKDQCSLTVSRWKLDLFTKNLESITRVQ